MSLTQIAGARATGRRVGTAAVIGAVGALYSSLSHLINLPAEPDQAGTTLLLGDGVINVVRRDLDGS